MKKICLRAVWCVIALVSVLAFAGCDENKNIVSEVQTQDTALNEAQESAVQDIGEHKDYASQESNGYYSNGILIVDQDGNKRAMETFIGDEDSALFYANELNTMQERLGLKVNVYSMIVPTACELYCPSNYRADIDSQSDIINEVSDMLVSVKDVNILETLNNHNAEKIYFRTDTRWAPLGGYYAGKVFAKVAGVGYADLSDYTKVSNTEFVGNMANYVDYEGLEDLEKQPELFTYYMPKCKYKTYYYDEDFDFLTEDKFFEEVPDAMYDTFYKGGFYCLKISTEAKNGRKLIMVKDSFGTAIIPFLTSSFEDIYVVDIDYLQANLVEMITDFEITDVLYVVNTFTATGTRAYQLETLRSQATHGRLEDNAPDYNAETTSSTAHSNTDTENDSEDGDQYIYGVGLNNQIGVIENPEYDEEGTGEGEYYEDYNEYDYNDYTDYTEYDDNTYNDYDNSYDYEEDYDYSEDYSEEW